MLQGLSPGSNTATCAVTALFLAGLLERVSRRIGSMGVDSLLVQGTHGLAVALRYGLR